MMTRTLNGMLERLRYVALGGRKEAGDAELLEAFIARRDQDAFAVLVRRHGPMVLGVCRRVLQNEADAEDAFQATFLVLVRRARSIRPRGMVGNWLYGVAQRTAMKAKAMIGKRRSKEMQAGQAGREESWSRLQGLLDEELVRLQEKYRVPIVLCEIEGLGIKEAARQLGCPQGTLASRLSRGRQMLAKRLSRDGWPLSVAALAAFLAEKSALASVPPALAAATVKAGTLAGSGMAAGTVSSQVASLADAVVKAMFLAKLRVPAALSFFFVACTLGAGVFLSGQAAESTAAEGPLAGTKKGFVEKIEPIADHVEFMAGQLRKQPLRRRAGVDTLGLYLMSLETKELTLIAGEPDQDRGYCGSPTWSADGRRIFFDASPGMDWSKTRIQQLEATRTGVGLSGLGPGNCPTISPDGKRIAFLLNLPGARSGLYLMNADGGERRYLGSYGRPKWSPDGAKLLNVSFGSPTPLSLIDPETGEEKTIKLKEKIYSVPSWLDEKTLVAVVALEKGLAIARVDISDPAAASVKEVLWRRGDGTGDEPMYPVYSSRTNRCVFAGRAPEGQTLYMFEPGKQPQRLEPERRDAKVASLALSPDGRYLLFSSDRE